MIFPDSSVHPVSGLPGRDLLKAACTSWPYASSHQALDQDQAVQEEARNVARAVAKAVVDLRAGRLQAGPPNLTRPRPK